ncbi:TetR/AcrR family transcriptional regulator [Acetobacterium sp.]|jgi:AcrR family transcriptional regulator|uniref:TetR/AcrR family transcriptional regulator n=1 Tax=Acetobacterium sp. TaxID=1872094 RepID=UPI002729236B|nr:TetR/AcrR family transcriptional regulator [Acetobacterium sp.]MDO9492583.1 TetR/AcrR family transcriptional regulator [Acetobacterium sp.]
MSRVIKNPKQLILSQAKEILYRQGYQKLSMRALSKACNIALGTIYNYYPTKKDLVVEMMSDYWQRFLDSVAEIIDSDTDIYLKLNHVFTELEVFIKNFRQYWLTPELYVDQDYVEGGLQKESGFMEKLIELIATELTKEDAAHHIKLKLGARETANFIIMNFITIIQMPFFRYQTFALFLKELLE